MKQAAMEPLLPAAARAFNFVPRERSSSISMSGSVPARIVPPERALPPLRLLRTVVDNPIKAWPRAIYRERIVRSPVLGRDTVYVMAPAPQHSPQLAESIRAAKRFWVMGLNRSRGRSLRQA